jgi:hypothetical protein
MMSVCQLLIVSGTDITIDDSSGVFLEGAYIFDAQDKLRESEFLGQGIIIRDVFRVIHETFHFNDFLTEG